MWLIPGLRSHFIPGCENLFDCFTTWCEIKTDKTTFVLFQLVAPRPSPPLRRLNVAMQIESSIYQVQPCYLALCPPATPPRLPVSPDLLAASD